ncbi:MAG: ankyrin repeat domain-containing protein [Cyanobacteria bacterium J06638_28]
MPVAPKDFILAIIRGEAETVRQQLAQGINPNTTNQGVETDGHNTALMWAATEGHLAIAQLLLA